MIDTHTLNKENYTIESWVEKYPDYDVHIEYILFHSSYDEFKKTNAYKNNIPKINKFLSECFAKSLGKINIFPFPDLLFAALNMTPLDEIIVVVLGQDPYFNSFVVEKKIVPQAMGMSFSVPIGIKQPPSLINIYKNMIKFRQIKQVPDDGNLTRWADQGCLMLNTVLTVEEKCPNGHKDIWTNFTDGLIKFISDNTCGVVFMLWGAPALNKLELIDTKKHMVSISSHPSPMSFQTKLRGYESFINVDHFGEANKYLEKCGKKPIVW